MKGQVLLQYIAPHHLLSDLVRHATRWRWRPWKHWLIARLIRKFDIDLDQAAQPDPAAYANFNAFFTRALRPDARPCDPDPQAVVSPADGRISQIGAIQDGRILQAKGQTFTVAELLADDTTAHDFEHGAFATIYLSPRDYHRVHMPASGTLLHTVHVPGRIFSVAPFAVAAIPRLFARNERLVCHFQGEAGPFVVVMVGAMLVSSISTVWADTIAGAARKRITRTGYAERDVRLNRGTELGHFNMGSTVIVLLPHGADFDPLAPDAPVRVGQRLGHWPGHAAMPAS